MPVLLILINLKAKQLFDVNKLFIILLFLVIIRIAALIRLICSELNQLRHRADIVQLLTVY